MQAENLAAAVAADPALAAQLAAIRSTLAAERSRGAYDSERAWRLYAWPAQQAAVALGGPNYGEYGIAVQSAAAVLLRDQYDTAVDELVAADRAAQLAAIAASAE